MADLDKLVVQIESDSSSAAQGIDALATSLGTLKTATSGGLGLSSIARNIESIKTSLSGIGQIGKDTQGLTKAVLTLKQLGGIKVSSSIGNQIKNIGESLSNLQLGDGADKIRDLVSALEPLGTLGKSNLPSVANALDKLPKALANIDMRQLYTQISSLTRIMKPLAEEMQKIANGFNAFPNRIQRLIQDNERLTQSNTRVSGSYINLWAKCKMAYNVLKTSARTIASLIKKSNDYIENVNLFSASMGDYAGKAKEYAEQVGELMGIDPGEWMRNQGVFMTLATGFGVASDRAYTMSKNLTQLGYDLSSFFNISYEDAMLKLQSGLAGELEPLRRIGYDLSVARLQQEAYTLGINKKVSAMTQAEKAELRYHAILTQVTVAQGDMARTLDAPANQLRILKAQVEQAGRAIGNIFIPLLNKVLPYLIALAKVVKLVADVFASLFGFKMPEVDYSGIGSLASGAEGASDALGDAAKNAKKLKQYTMGFDELNVIDPNSGSGGSGGSAGVGGSGFDFELPDYSKKFLEGITNSKVSEIVEKMKEWLGLTEKIDSWSEFFDTNLGQILLLVGEIGFAIGAWKLSIGLIKGISALKTALKGLGNLAKGFTIGLGATIAVSGLVIEWTGIIDAFRNGLDGLNFAEILGGSALVTVGGAVIGKALGSTILGAAIGGIVAGIPMFVTGVYDAIMNGLNWLNGILIPAGATMAGAGIGAIIGMLGGPIGAGIGALIGLAIGGMTDIGIIMYQNWETITKWFDTNVCEPIATFFEDLWLDIKGTWKNTSSWFESTIVEPIVGFFEELWNSISEGASASWGVIEELFFPAVDWFSNLFEGIFLSVSDSFYNIGVIAKGCWEVIKVAWGNVKEWFDTTVIQPVSTFFSGLWNGISSSASSAWTSITEVYGKVEEWVKTNVTEPATTLFSGLWEGFKTDASEAWEGTKEVFSTVGEFFKTTFSDAWAGIVEVFSTGGEIFVDIKDGVVSAFKIVVNALITGINKVVSVPFEKINETLDAIRSAEIAGFRPFSSLKRIHIPQIPLLAEGGMISGNGQAFIAREAGPELVGTIGRRTAVVNNDQIVESISYGVATANEESNSLLREQNTLLRAMLEKESGVYLDGKKITKNVEKHQRDRGRVLVTGGAY